MRRNNRAVPVVHLLQSSALYQLYVSLPEKEPFLFITEDCPPDIKKRPLEEWPKVKAATKKEAQRRTFYFKRLLCIILLTHPHNGGFYFGFFRFSWI